MCIYPRQFIVQEFWILKDRNKTKKQETFPEMSECTSYCSECCHDTYTAAFNGHLDCLKFYILQGSPWHTATTWAAAYHDRQKCSEICLSRGICKYRECLEFIFKECSEHETWETSGLETKLNDFLEAMNSYILDRKEEWIWYGDRRKNIKGDT